MKPLRKCSLFLVVALAGCAPEYDVVIRGGTVYDGSGNPGIMADVAIVDDTIASIGQVDGRGGVEIDATGMAVAPGFINVLSWATESLIEDGRSELLFGESEVLVAAKHLLNDMTVIRRTGGEVTYVHLLFDEHQVVYSEGLASESFQPGPLTTADLDAEVMAEICTIFPELDPATGAGYGPSRRLTLKPHEAEVLLAAGRRAA